MTQHFFIADTHFNHANIIRYCKRPFSNVEEMNNVLIENINSKVGEADILWHLGDWGFGRCEGIRELRGKILISI